ncbi:MAG: hypothetical protein QM820_19190 [Minicystis sp.]
MAAHSACAAEFAGAHLCHASEYLLSRSATAVPAAGAWLDSSVDQGGSQVLNGLYTYGRHTGYSCTSFTSAGATGSGTYVQPSGAVTWGSSNVCSAVRPLACCNGAPKIVFAGLSSSSYTGNIGGRPAANAVCNAEFSGAHVCHAAEYLRSASTVTVPPEGAWVESSADPNGSQTLQGAPAFGLHTGYSCTSFTSASTTGSGTYIQPSGGVTWGSSNVCSTSRRIACCY